MQILQVDLDNVKSYEHATLPFGLGTNAICGHNGAGKSTVLEAIGFALFDYLAVPQADFVREGEKTATVTVHVADRDGRRYQVVRRCGSSSQHYVYDPELDHKLAEGKQDTMAWLHQFMGIDGSGELDVLFRDAVGVPQGLLTAAFLDTPSRRKDTFNPLLRVDEYERVWEGLREPARHLDRQIADQQARIAGFEAQVTALPDLRERAAYLATEIAVGDAQQAELEEAQVEATADLAVLTARKERLDALDHALAEADAARQALQVRLETARAAVVAAEAAQAIVAATQEGHEAYLEAQGTQDALEAARQARDALVSDRQGVEQALAVIEERASQLAAELTAIADAKATMARLAPDVVRQEKLEAEHQTAQREADRLASAEAELARETARLAELNRRHGEAAAQAAMRVQREAALTEAREALTSWMGRREHLSSQVGAVEIERAQTEVQIAAAEQRLEAAERRTEQERDRLAQLEARLEIVQAQLSELDDVEAARQATREALSALDAKRQVAVEAAATCDAALAQLQRQIALLATAEEPRCPLCGEPLTAEHRAELLAQNHARAGSLRDERADAEQAVASVAAAITEQEQQLARLESRARALPRPQEVQALEAQRASQETAVAESAAAINAEKEALTRHQARLAVLESKMETLQPDLAAAAQQVDEHQTVVDALAEGLQGLARTDEVKALAHEVAQHQATVTAAEAATLRLAAAPDDVKRLSEALATLGNPRRAHDRAADVAAGEAEALDQQAVAEAEIDQLQAQVAELDEALAAYADLDDRILAVRQALAQHEAAHQRYLQHEREAGALAERRATVTKLDAERETTEAAYTETAAARAAVAAEYDAGLHAKLTDELAEARAASAAIAERLRQYRSQLDETTAAIAELEAVEAHLQAAQSELTAHRETLALLAYLRQVLREAGPEITRALVQMISLHADRLYADIMQNYQSRLRWTEDYDIVLTTEGRARTFQQLSGGEQMAAGLAVRLALLREISTVDVAFFDEPTANLDAARRANLAQQILNIRGFSQLFVISHDDTFEQDTDHVLRVQKMDGASIVETGAE
ncbi:MAG: SMC family ATPase [Anaerolineae bacterium]|nr:SMC family ATPase [Anaerolineae bacterium]